MDKFEVIWQAPEFEYRAKETGWYWKSVFIAVAILAVAVWQRNFLFGFFVVVAEMLLIVWGERQPRQIDFKINEVGLRVGENTFYPYPQLEYFSVIPREGEWNEIGFHRKGRLQPLLKVQVPKNKTGELQEKLELILTHVEHEESLIDTFERFMGF